MQHQWFNVRLSREEHEWIKRLASEHDLSMQRYILGVLRLHLVKQGLRVVGADAIIPSEHRAQP